MSIAEKIADMSAGLLPGETIELWRPSSHPGIINVSLRRTIMRWARNPWRDKNSPAVYEAYCLLPVDPQHPGHQHMLQELEKLIEEMHSAS